MSANIVFLFECGCPTDEQYDSCRKCKTIDIPDLPPKPRRVKDTLYRYNGQIKRWDGKQLQKVCNEPGCRKQPSYGNEDGIARYCATHKKPGMVDVVNKRCQEPGCRIHPCYGNEEDGIARYCATHKKPGMVNVVHKCCQEPG